MPSSTKRDRQTALVGLAMVGFGVRIGISSVCRSRAVRSQCVPFDSGHERCYCLSALRVGSAVSALARAAPRSLDGNAFDLPRAG